MKNLPQDTEEEQDSIDKVAQFLMKHGGLGAITEGIDEESPVKVKDKKKLGAKIEYDHNGRPIRQRVNTSYEPSRRKNS